MSASLPAEKSLGLAESLKNNETNSTCETPLVELPCEVQIKEEPMDLVGGSGTQFLATKTMTAEELLDSICNTVENIPQEDYDLSDTEKKGEISNSFNNDSRMANSRGAGNGGTSILEQVLTGSLTLNDRKEVKPKFKLSSKWWCPPCNRYYR